MKILIACEESQRVTEEFRKIGHEAYSCDIIDCSGKHSEWHIKQDVIPLLNGNCTFKTCDGQEHKIAGKWDMIIAFPPCTYLTVTGNRWFNIEKYGDKARKRMKDREKASEFFMQFVNADCDRIAIENPVGYMNTHYRKPNQIIHPYYFGDAFQKRTCLWLKNLPELQPTELLPKPEPMYICQGEKCNGKKIGWCEGIKGTTGGQEGRAKARSKTFPGIAKAMAAQWSLE